MLNGIWQGPSPLSLLAFAAHLYSFLGYRRALVLLVIVRMQAVLAFHHRFVSIGRKNLASPFLFLFMVTFVPVFASLVC
jgi:hypothetical protein